MIRDEFDLMIHGQCLRVLYIRHESVAVDYPTLVFLHDSLGCITLWRDFPERLAKATGCNALVYDRQGYGQSSPFTTPRTLNYLMDEAHILARVLERCDIPSAILFGHSDGGSISLLAAAEYPERIACVISEAAHVFVDHLTVKGIRKAIEQYKTTNLRERIARYHGSKTDAVFAAWTQTWLAEWYQHWSIEKYLSRIQCPVMVIQGERDEFGTQAQLVTIAQQVGGVSQPCLMRGVGHTPHKDASDEVLRSCAEFIGSFLPKKGKKSTRPKAPIKVKAKPKKVVGKKTATKKAK
jgi:pimeloyl-ACP methyl ester carboxylesterase